MITRTAIANRAQAAVSPVIAPLRIRRRRLAEDSAEPDDDGKEFIALLFCKRSSPTTDSRDHKFRHAVNDECNQEQYQADLYKCAEIQWIARLGEVRGEHRCDRVPGFEQLGGYLRNVSDYHRDCHR